jgi:hypothetical protein
MTTQTSIPFATAEVVAGEKTPLLISVADENVKPVGTTSSASAANTPSTAATTVVTPSPRPRSPINNTTNANPGTYLEQKAEAIEFLLSQPEVDLWKLRGHALTPGGLVNGRYCSLFLAPMTTIGWRRAFSVFATIVAHTLLHHSKP